MLGLEPRETKAETDRRPALDEGTWGQGRRELGALDQGSSESPLSLATLAGGRHCAKPWMCAPLLFHPPNAF